MEDTTVVRKRSIDTMSFHPLAEGAHAPSVTFKARVRNDALGRMITIIFTVVVVNMMICIGGENPFEWKDVTSDALFKGNNPMYDPL